MGPVCGSEFAGFLYTTEMSKAGVKDLEAGPIVALPDRRRGRVHQRMKCSTPAGERRLPTSVIAARAARPLVLIEDHGYDRNGP